MNKSAAAKVMVVHFSNCGEKLRATEQQPRSCLVTLFASSRMSGRSAVCAENVSHVLLGIRNNADPYSMRSEAAEISDQLNMTTFPSHAACEWL